MPPPIFHPAISRLFPRLTRTNAHGQDAGPAEPAVPDPMAVFDALHVEHLLTAAAALVSLAFVYLQHQAPSTHRTHQLAHLYTAREEVGAAQQRQAGPGEGG